MTWPASLPSLSPGDILTAADMDEIVAALDELGDAWTPYTPTLTASTTNPTMGSSSLTGAYRLVGKTCDWRINFAVGAGFAAGSGGYILTLPPGTTTLVAVASAPMGFGLIRDTSVPSARPVIAYRFSSTQVAMLDSTTGSVITHNSPYAWATGDLINIEGRFETA